MLLCYFTWQDSRWGYPAFSDRQTTARTEGHDHWRWSARHRVSIIHGHENLWLEKDRKPDGQKEIKRRIGNLQCRCKSLNTSQVAQTAGAYPQHEATRSIATPPGWDASPSQVTTVHQYPFILLGGERHCESKMSCPRTQHSAPARARTRTSRSGVQRPNH